MTARCRRCHRPLSSPLAVAALLGERCALLVLAEAVSARQAAVDGPTPAQSAVALTAAFLQGSDDQVPVLLDEADLRDVAGLFAATVARVLEGQPDGVERLRRFGLVVAGGSVR